VNFKEEEQTTFDIMMQHRKFNQQNAGQTNQTANSILPPELERGYQVFIVYGENEKKTIQKMRELRSN
jgi:hypothetical protein